MMNQLIYLLVLLDKNIFQFIFSLNEQDGLDDRKEPLLEKLKKPQSNK